jgi:hypothetical protein
MTADPAAEAARAAVTNWLKENGYVDGLEITDPDAYDNALIAVVVAAVRPVIVEECAQAIEAAPDGKWVRYTKTDYANILRALAGTETQA